MEYKIDIPWREYQKQTLRDILSAPLGSINVIKSPRQCGKTTLLESLLLFVSIGNKGACSIFVEPTQKQARKVFREVRKAIENTPICLTANESTLDITFTNGSQIIFVSGESDISALQGFVCKKGGMLIIDEAAFINDDVIFALAPTTDVHKAKTILASTPRFRAGLFYDYFIDGLTPSSNIRTFDWSNQTILTPEKLEFYRKTLPSNTFKNYYLGEWAEFGSNVFGDISACLSTSYTPTRPKTIRDEGVGCVFGVDWGTGSGNDDTAICIYNTLGEMMRMVYFNDKNSTETIEYIIALAREYNPSKIQVELNSIGKVFYELLSKQLKINGIQSSLIGFNTGNNSKNKLVDNFAMAVQNGTVKILNDEKLLHQLSVFESKLTQSGKVTYAASKNNHDDLIMAMLLAYDCLKAGSYSYI